MAVGAAVYWSNDVSGQKAKSDEGGRTATVTAPQARAVDDFSYATGQLTDASGGANTSGGVWVTNTGTGSFLQVSAGSLSYAGYPSSGVGNKLNMISTTGSAEDTFRNFPTQTSGTTYGAFMVNVTDTTGLAPNSSTTGDYFAGFISSTSTTAFVNRVTIRAGTAAGTYQLGFRATGNAGNVQTFGTDLPVGTTALVVISYQLVAGATNDVCNMWVNPVITSPEPAPTFTQVSASDNADVGRFFFRQGNAGTPNASVDGVRVGNSWADLITAPPSQNVVDMNGDGRTDFVVVRNTGGGPSGQITWFVNLNNSATSYGSAWGISGDTFVPNDYDGDNKTDIAVWRGVANGQPSGNAFFYILQSATSTVRIDDFGQTGDDATVVGDYDGDGKADPAVYRAGLASGLQSTWYFRGSLTPGNITGVQWGVNGDFPAPGDYDGDGKGDFVIQRNNGGGQAKFWMLQTTAGFQYAVFGTPTDVVVPGDYDGDGKTDIAVSRGSAGQVVWYVRPSSTGVETNAGAIFGLSATDFRVQGDYDGDGKTDLAIWRPSATPGASAFWVQGSTGSTFSVPFGQNGDYPVANYDVH